MRFCRHCGYSDRDVRFGDPAEEEFLQWWNTDREVRALAAEIDRARTKILTVNTPLFAAVSGRVNLLKKMLNLINKQKPCHSSKYLRDIYASMYDKDIDFAYGDLANYVNLVKKQL